MNILILSTYEKQGGAAIAAKRLCDAYNTCGSQVAKYPVCARMLVMGNGVKQRLDFLIERSVIFAYNGFKRQGVFAVDVALYGTDITKTKAFQWADVIHLHWINQGFLSIEDLKKIFNSGKRIIWTMHDQWPFTGICHYSDDCNRYKKSCSYCPLLKSNFKDISKQIFAQKHTLYNIIRETKQLSLVGCSNWMADLASNSALVRGLDIVSIPNPIDTDFYHPEPDKYKLRRELNLPSDISLLLFSAYNISEERKGFRYLSDALHIISEKELIPKDKLGLVIVGKIPRKSAFSFDFQIFQLGYLSDQSMMMKIYAAVDAFVTPSLQDNLPNTIMESMACGTPCVGFDTGGIPEMIDHLENGYVAKTANAADLAKGICYTIDPNNHYRLAQSVRTKVERDYNPTFIVQKYLETINKTII